MYEFRYARNAIARTFHKAFDGREVLLLGLDGRGLA